MSQDPYTPPSARVADQPIDLGPRPGQVTLAVALLWISFLLGIPTWYLGALRDPENLMNPAVLVFTVIVFALCAALNVLIYRGRNWARMVAAALVAISIVLLLLPAEEAVPASAMENSLTWIGLLLDCVALYLLFSMPGAAWFRRSRS